MFVGAVLIGATQFMLHDVSSAITTLAIFLVAGSRIAPAVLRLQQGTVLIKTALGSASPTLDLIDALGTGTISLNNDDSVDVVHEGFTSEIVIEDFSLTYPRKITPAT